MSCGGEAGRRLKEGEMQRGEERGRARVKGGDGGSKTLSNGKVRTMKASRRRSGWNGEEEKRSQVWRRQSLGKIPLGKHPARIVFREERSPVKAACVSSMAAVCQSVIVAACRKWRLIRGAFKDAMPNET